MPCCSVLGLFLPFFLMDNSWLFLLLFSNLSLYPWPSLSLFFTSLTFANWNNFGCCRYCNENSCYFCEICGPLEGPRSLLYSFAKFVILAIFLACFFLTNVNFSLSIFLKICGLLFFIGMNVCKICYSWY